NLRARARARVGAGVQRLTLPTRPSYNGAPSPAIPPFRPEEDHCVGGGSVMPAPSMEAIVSLCKRRGFIFPGSEIYGGLQGTYDYGPLGVELENNLKAAWWRANVYERDDMEGLDSAVLMNPLVWRYSGHEETFIDPLVDCRNCKSRWRAD